MSVCVNDTNGDGDCAACARNPEAPCRMSAREALIRSVYSKLSQNQMEKLIDAYAHELAGQQRNWDAEAEGYTDPQMAVYAVADLIDPRRQT